MKIKLWTINNILRFFGLVLTLQLSDDKDADESPTILIFEKRSTFFKRCMNKD